MMTTDDVADLPTLVRWRRALRALARVMMNPEETDQVLVFSNLANAGQRDERLHLFYDDPRVLTISLHESGHYLYPGTGFPDEIGVGASRNIARAGEDGEDRRVGMVEADAADDVEA